MSKSINFHTGLSGKTADFDWWPDGRLKRITDPVGQIDFEYDSLGRVHTVTEGNATITRTYDDRDRLESFTDSSGNTIGYEYDGSGNLKKLIYPDLKEVTYTYTTGAWEGSGEIPHLRDPEGDMSGSEGVNCPAADRLDAITDWGNRTVDFQYDADSRLQIVQLPNNTRRVYSYDFAGRLAAVRQEQTSTGNLIVELTYQYDALDRIEQETGTPEPTPFTVPIALMTYDADDRLDTFNGLQCMSDLDGNLVTGPLNGNLTGFTFDARNRLVEVGNATFGYDADGRRVSKTENGTATSYVHDPQASLSRMLTATTSNSTTFYVYAPGGMLLYEDSPAGLRVPHQDYRGSTVALSNATGAVIGRVVYGTYGEVVSRTGDTDTRFLFHGAYGVEADANGLCLMRARYYNPETRRFLNADPIGFGGGTNWYGFVQGIPTIHVDPAGLDIYLKGRGGEDRLFHLKIVVDTPNGQVGYSFGVGEAWRDRLGQIDVGLGDNGSRNGAWFEDQSDGKVIKRIRTTPEQDAEFHGRLEGLEGDTSHYSIWHENCRHYVEQVFEEARARYESSKP